MNKNHVEMKNKVKELLDGNFSEEEIGKKLELKIGKNSLEKGTVNWYKRCIEKTNVEKRLWKLEERKEHFPNFKAK